jgi:hypothetical protein
MLTDLPWAGLLAMMAVVGVLASGMSLLHDFPWDALATLLAGVAAVIGAVYIGKRQMAISRGQNKILERQADIASRQADILAQQVQLESLKLRSELFERRFKVFEATHAFLIAAYNGEDMTGHQATIDFKRARDEGRFLFDERVSTELEEVHKHGWQYRALQGFVNANAEQGRGDPEKDLEAVMEAQMQIGRDITSLPTIFGRHLSINDVSPAASDSLPPAFPSPISAPTAPG